MTKAMGMAAMTNIDRKTISKMLVWALLPKSDSTRYMLANQVHRAPTIVLKPEIMVMVRSKSALSGYYMATSTNGNQFKSAPFVGRIMADLISAS
jgi:hypothetical protein